MQSKKSPLKGICYGSYWMGVNDIVFLMHQELSRICHLSVIDTHIYDGNFHDYLTPDYSINKHRPIYWLKHKQLLKDVERFAPDFIMVNSGGMGLTMESANYLKSKKIITIGISLSDPDVFPDHGKRYFNNFDIFYTNSLYSIQHQYVRNEKIKHLPFAASENMHSPQIGYKRHDIVIVGHARKNRIDMVNRLRMQFNVGTYGNGWGPGTSAVHGINHAKAINSGKIYLSDSSTVAGYLNVKVGVFEAAACKSLIITEKNEEIDRYFSPGFEVLQYENEVELVDLIEFYLRNPEASEWIANNCYKRFLKDHTWKSRLEKVLEDVSNYRNER